MSQSEVVARASAGNPCDVCGSESSGCSRLADGARFCRGTPLDPDAFTKLKDTDHAGFAVYRRTEETAAGKAKRGKGRKGKALPSLPPKPATTATEPATDTTPKPAIDWAGRVERFADADHFPPETQQAAAAQLGVPVESLAEFTGIGANGFNGDDVNVTFPERDANGEFCGITERRPNEKPKHFFHPGGTRGLSIPKTRFDSDQTVFVVEGATDTLALTAAGIPAVGRPGAEGKTQLLAMWLTGLPSETPIVVVGENDEKPDGKTPGRDGAIKVARELTAALGREVRWTLPPVGSKDVRDWLKANTSSRERAEWLRAGKELQQSLIDAANTVLIESPNPTDQANQATQLDHDNGRNDDPATWDCTPDNPLRLAQGFLATQSGPDGELLLRYWRSEYYRWFGGAYRHVEEEELQCQLVAYVHTDAARVHSLELAAWNRKSSDGRGPAPKVRNVTTGLISNVVQAFRSLIVLSSSVDAPAWIDGCTGPEPRDLVVCANGIFDTATGTLLPPNPHFFTFAATTFDYDATATRAEAWGKFLHDIWGKAPDQIDALQEWLGYLLTSDTSAQKMLFLIGPPRAGKGTIGRVIEELVGRGNVISPKLSSLSNNFGLAPLLNKTVALVSDLRLSESLDVHLVVENMLSITGEDTFTVDRKFLSVVTAKLPTRLVVMSNELPRLGDTSGAIYTRMILLRLTESFLGKEDQQLTRKLISELPAIFNWAILGLRRLRERGRFTQPIGGLSLLQQMRDIGSPVGAFVRECCEIKDGEKCEVDELFSRWGDWCRKNGRKDPGSIQTFGRNLSSCSLKIEIKKQGPRHERTRYYCGIRLLSASERAEMADDDVGVRDVSASVLDVENLPGTPKHYENQCETDLFSSVSAVSSINGIHPPPCGRTQAQAHAGTHTLAHTHTQDYPPNIADTADTADTESGNSAIHEVKEGGACPSHRGHIEGTIADTRFKTVDLYVTRKLDFLELPRGSATEVVTISNVEYHLVSPIVMAFLESIADKFDSGELAAERAAYLEDMVRIWAYVSARYTREEIALARESRPNDFTDELCVI